MDRYGKRYLTHKEFIDLCKDLEFDQIGFRPDEGILEYLEKEKVFFPVIRLTFPEEAVRYFYLLKYEQPESLVQRKFNLPKEWEEVYRLDIEMSNFNGLSLDQILFHPFDKNKKVFQDYISNPSQQTFKNWNEYKIPINPKNLGTINESTTEHFYSYWQAYLAHEIMTFCTRKYFVNTLDEDIKKELLERKYNIDSAKRWQLPKKRANIQKRVSLFDALSFYVQSKQKLDNLSFLSWTDDHGHRLILTEVGMNKYRRYENLLARITVNRFSLDESQLIEFLKFLGSQYFDYKEDKFDKLADFIKKDISNLIDIIENVYKIPYEKLIDIIGRGNHHIQNTLEVIFPNKIKEAKEEAFHSIKSSLAENSKILNKGIVTDAEIMNFLSFMENNELHIFYQSINRVNENWISNSRSSRSELQSSIMNLSMLLENIIKTIGVNSKDPIMREEFLRFGQMEETLRKFYRDAKWWSELANNWKITTIDGNTNPELKIMNEIMPRLFHNNKLWDSIIKTFLVSGVARNVSAHQHQKLYLLDGKAYQLMINNIVSAIWFTWKYAIEKGYLL